MKIERTIAYRKGYQAFADKKDLTDNPYNDDEDHFLWCLGWFDREDQSQRPETQS